MPNLNIEVSDEQYEQLREVKDAHALTWKALLIQGAKSLDTDEPL